MAENYSIDENYSTGNVWEKYMNKGSTQSITTPDTTFDIDTTWKSGTLNEQLQSNYGMSPDEANKLAVEFAGSGANDFNTFAQSRGIGQKGSTALPTKGNVSTELTTKDKISAALGLGQLGLGIMGYMDQRDVLKEQKKGLEQQREQAGEEYEHKKKARSALQSGLGAYQGAGV